MDLHVHGGRLDRLQGTWDPLLGSCRRDRASGRGFSAGRAGDAFRTERDHTRLYQDRRRSPAISPARPKSMASTCRDWRTSGRPNLEKSECTTTTSSTAGRLSIRRTRRIWSRRYMNGLMRSCPITVQTHTKVTSIVTVIRSTSDRGRKLTLQVKAPNAHRPSVC